ncbi:hypothetical protein SNE40_002585 [Patella caerulea]|uniref:Hyaluronidase n=1 Tax=Patella caerulea TaxID=87958 RepID=A0AAN8K8R1_PATCE
MTSLVAVLILVTPILFSHLINAVTGMSEDEGGCTGPTILPNHPFVVVWNVPSGGCDAHGIKLNFSQYGIVTNKNDVFRGEMMTIFYGIGDFPSISGSQLNNGGVPQRGNLTLHLSKAKKQIEDLIPDANFKGISVLDFEAWRPIYQTNFDSLAKYQQLSIEVVKQLHPDWTNKTQIYNEAVKEFNEGAKNFFQSTLEVAEKLRPGGHWGYYGFPACRGVNPKTNICGNEQVENDNLSWLWELSTAVYPRIYTAVGEKINPRQKGVEHVVNETLRMKAKYMSPGTMILPYTLVQNGGTYFFDEADLGVAIKVPGDMGSSGVVVWGSNGQFHERGECVLLQTYLDFILGPYVLKLTNFYTSCSKTKCSGHGRCVNQKYELLYQKYLHQYGGTYCKKNWKEIKHMDEKLRHNYGKKTKFDVDDYVCSCYTGWKGNKCNIKTK